MITFLMLAVKSCSSCLRRSVSLEILVNDVVKIKVFRRLWLRKAEVIAHTGQAYKSPGSSVASFAS